MTAPHRHRDRPPLHKPRAQVITNAFGGVLDEKIVAENYLRASGLDYTIVRPGDGRPLADPAPTLAG